MKFTQFHMDILEELDNENGIVRSPYFVDGCYVVYSVKNGCLTLWVFQDSIDKYLSIPTYYICVSPKDKIKGAGHQLDCMVLPLLDNCMEANIRDYIDMVLDYLCLRQWAEVQLGKVSTTVKKKSRKIRRFRLLQNLALITTCLIVNGIQKFPMMNRSRLVDILDCSLMEMVQGNLSG